MFDVNYVSYIWLALGTMKASVKEKTNMNRHYVEIQRLDSKIKNEQNKEKNQRLRLTISCNKSRMSRSNLLIYVRISFTLDPYDENETST